MEATSPRRVRWTCARHALLIALVGSLAACASGGQRSLRDGVLRPGIGQKAVLTEWGLPERTLSVGSEEQLRARWGRLPEGQPYPSRRPLDLWLYEKAGVELVFDDGDLALWKTDRSGDQLRALLQPPTAANPVVGIVGWTATSRIGRLGSTAFRSVTFTQTAAEGLLLRLKPYCTLPSLVPTIAIELSPTA